MPTVLLFLVVLTLVIAGGVAKLLLLQKQRRQGCEQAAREMGFTFSPLGDGGFASRLGRFQLFSQGHGAIIRNLIEGSARGCEVRLFDCEISSNSDGPDPNQTAHFAW